MAAIISHLVVGERVFRNLGRFTFPDFGVFLLGTILVDVHIAGPIDRCVSHFSKGLETSGRHAFQRSCENFISQMPDLLQRPWNDLANAEQAFAAGYLCHLAADEAWKQFDWESLQSLGKRWWADLHVPGNVIMTAFEISSSDLYLDRQSVISALSSAAIPNVFKHIPYPVFEKLWEISKAPALGGPLPEAYFEMLDKAGVEPSAVQTERDLHIQYLDEAFIVMQRQLEGIQPRLESMLRRSLEIVPRLWE